MILTACFVAPAQRIAIFTLNFTLLRIMVVFGFTRLLTRGELRSFRWKFLDTTVITWALFGTVAYILLWGTGEAVKYRSGWLFDVAGMYFLFRALIRDWDDVDMLVAAFAVVSVPVALAFLVENQTSRNLFAFFGGVPEVTAIREGRLRCQGAFAHAILAGCFWAIVLPLIAARLWNQRKSRTVTVIGIVASLTIIVLCASSTPASALLVAIPAALTVVLRAQLHYVRWGIVLVLTGLQIVMTHPVWYLFSKIDLVGGSTGWHRYWVMDIAIRNLGDWWLLGTTNALKWTTPGTAEFLDITNQYILEGIDGGLLAVGLFVAVIVVAFRGVGALWRSVASDRARLAMAWALGVALFVHVMNFFGVSYFGQIIMLWYMTLAIIGSLTPARLAAPAVAGRPVA